MVKGKSGSPEGERQIKSEAGYKKRIRSIRHGIFVMLFFSFLVFVAIAALAIVKVGIDKFLSTLALFNPLFFVAALLTIFAAYCMRFPKWMLYLHRLGVRLPIIPNFLIYLSMYSMDITPGRWGRGIVSYTINRLTGISFGSTFPAVVADILTDSLGFAVIAIGSALLIGRFVYISLFFILLLLIPFIFLFIRKPFEFVKRYLYRFRRMRRYFDIGDLYFESHKLLGLDVYIYSMLFTIPSMFLNGFALYLIILGLGINLPASYLAIVIFIYSSSFLVGMVSGIPGSLGITDGLLIGSLTLLLGSFIDFQLAATITILFRIVTVWFVEAFGSVALFHTMKYWEPNSRLGVLQEE